jgi:integrase
MPRALQVVSAIPSLSDPAERFLARSRFVARTRESYAQDLASLVAQLGPQPVTSLTPQVTAVFVAAQERLAASTFNRRYAALKSFVRWCQLQGWLADDPLNGLERRGQPRHGPSALDPERVETTLRSIRHVRDRALFRLTYDGGLRCNEALAINHEDVDWSERAIRVRGKGDHSREMFFSRRVSRYLDDYLKQRGQPTVGPLFITARKARSPRRADLTADGHARLSYRQADTLWKKCTPGWELHQLGHTAISARAAHGCSEIELKRFSGHRRCAASRCTSPTTARPPSAKRATGNAGIRRSANDCASATLPVVPTREHRFPDARHGQFAGDLT